MAANFIHVEVRSFNKNPFHKDYGMEVFKKIIAFFCMNALSISTENYVYFYGNEKNDISCSNPLAMYCVV